MLGISYDNEEGEDEDDANPHPLSRGPKGSPCHGEAECLTESKDEVDNHISGTCGSCWISLQPA